MRLVTIVSLGASAVLGLGALIVAKAMLPNGAAAAKVPGLQQAPIQGEPLVVASRPIKYGEKLEPGMLTVIKTPAAARPEGAYTTVASVLQADNGGAPVALIPMSSREPVLPTKLSGPGARPSVAAEIAENGMRAYTLKVNDATGVGGHALPGDHVDVVLVRDLTPDGPQRTWTSYVIVQNARVLGVDLNADLATQKPANPNTYTLEVSMQDSQKLSVAATVGTLSLALRKSGAADVAKVVPLRSYDFLGGTGAPRAAARPAGPPRPAFSGIIVIEGLAAKHAKPARAASNTATSKLDTAAAAGSGAKAGFGGGLDLVG
jgi:pilus assembly protein CpaB